MSEVNFKEWDMEMLVVYANSLQKTIRALEFISSDKCALELNIYINGADRHIDIPKSAISEDWITRRRLSLLHTLVNEVVPEIYERLLETRGFKTDV